MKKQNLQQIFDTYISQCQIVRRCRPDTIKGYQQVFGLFQRLMPEVISPDDLSEEKLTLYFNRVNTRKRIVGKGEVRIGVKESTIKTHWSKLNSFFEWMLTRGCITANPLAGLVPPQPDYSDKKALNKSDLEKVISAIQMKSKNLFLLRRDMAMFSTLLFCGIRKGELVGLQVRDIDLVKDVLTVRGVTSKSKRNRLVPINGALSLQLQDYVRERQNKKHTTQALFVSANRDKGLTHHGIKHWIKRLKEASGVDFHMHQLRHTFATNLARNGVSPIILQNLMGHTDPRMTERYVRSMTVEDYRKDIEKLNMDNMV